MRIKFDIRSLVMGALLGAVITFTVAAANDKPKTWDYTIRYQNSSHPDIEGIKKLSNDGWELVGSFSGPKAEFPGFIFKRER